MIYKLQYNVAKHGIHCAGLVQCCIARHCAARVQCCIVRHCAGRVQCCIVWHCAGHVQCCTALYRACTMLHGIVQGMYSVARHCAGRGVVASDHLTPSLCKHAVCCSSLQYNKLDCQSSNPQSGAALTPCILQSRFCNPTS